MKTVKLLILTIFICFCFSILTIADDKVTKPVELSPIAIPANIQEMLKQANKDLEIAQLKKDNLMLQVRLILKIPNDYGYDETAWKFNPPPKDETKPDKAIKP